MRWPFDKYAGCGNDFIIFDNRHNNFPLNSTVIRMLCHRRNGIGADGVLLREDSRHADAKMRIFNSDGSEAEMCGNGLRCFVKWLANKSGNRSPCAIEVNQRILAASHAGHDIRLEMGSPCNLQWNIPIAYENQELTIHHVDTGVPHTIVFVEDIETVNVLAVGSFVRHSWKPKGTNVTFAKQIGPQKYKIRTYERGVEGETPACGTGAAAAAFAAANLHHCPGPITIETLSGEELIVDFLAGDDDICRLSLIGPAHPLFHGEIDIL